ncbi:MAG: Gfo/Idh/MocA family oxidoreductase [Planctomycetota bacterium]
MNKLRFGILSTGNIARQLAQGVGTGGKRSNLAAAASRSMDSARDFARRYNIPTAHGSYDALLADPSVDTVYNALPNALHKQWTLKALAAGKHVLCEKPLAMNHAEAVQMFDAAKKHGRVLIEAFMYRCHPQTQAIVKAVRDGAIGQVKLVRTSFCYRTKKIAGNVRFDPALGGGALMDIGCYCIDFTRLILGEEPSSILAVGRMHDSGVDIAASGVMQYPSGAEATFSCGMDTQASNLAQVCGTEGYIDVPIPWKPPTKGASWSIRRMTPPKQDAGHLQPGPLHETHTADAGQPLYALQADAFARCVLDGEPAFVSPQDSLANARVLDELKRQVHP